MFSLTIHLTGLPCCDSQVARERRLRKASEQAAAAAADCVDAERQRQAARAAQEAAYLALKADNDRAWYEGETVRRQAAQAAAEAGRQKEQAQRKLLYQDLQSAAVLRQKEAQLLEHRSASIHETACSQDPAC